MKNNVKKVVSILLVITSLVFTMGIGVINSYALSKIEDSSPVGTEEDLNNTADNNHIIYFEVNTELWTDFTNITIYIYDHSNHSELFTWGSRNCNMNNEGDGIWSFDFEQKGITLEEGKQYGCIFTADWGVRTCDLIFDSTLYGDTAYCTGELVENSVDSNKMSYDVRWKNANPEQYGPPLCVSSLGNLLGNALWANTTKYDLLVNFIKSDGKDGLSNALMFNGKSEQQTIDDIAQQLDLSYDDVERAVKESGKTVNWRNPNANPSNSTGDCKWVLDDEGVLTITGRYNGGCRMEDYQNSDAPWGKNIKKVIIAEDVGSIGCGAFKDCSALTSATISDSVTSINEYAFEGCTALENINISGRVERINNSAFKGCTSLKTVSFAEPIPIQGWNYIMPLRIESEAFEDCKALSSIILPEHLDGFGNRIFKGCTSLSTAMIPDKFHAITDSMFEGCSKLSEIHLPENLDTIGISAFKNCTSLSKIYLSNKVTKIDYSVSYTGNGIGNSSSSGSSSSSSGGSYADEHLHFNDLSFAGCSGLTSITVSPDNPIFDSRDNCNAIINKSNNSLLLGCKNTVIPESIEIIGKSAFENCTGLTEIHIPNSVTEIEESAFKGSSLSDVELGDNISNIGLAAFSGLNNISVSVANSVYDSRNDCNAIIRTADNSLIIGSNNAIIPNDIESISSYAFYECTELSNISIPESVNSIRARVFWGCANLKTISIPDGVTTFGAYIFENNSDDLTITCLETSAAANYARGYYSYILQSRKPIKINSIPFIYNKLNDGTVEILAYTGTQPEIIIPDSIFGRPVSSMKKWFCANDTFIKSVTIPDTILELPKGAFYNCVELKTVTMGNNVTEIGANAFEKCLYLESINLSDNLQTIGDEAFYDCRRLKKLDIPATVTSIGEEAFTNCRSLTSLTIPKGVDKIGDESSLGYGMFENCQNLTEVTIPKTVSYIQSNAFDGCKNLTILGSSNSYAKSYAENNNIKFRAIAEDMPIGDANGDNTVDVLDAAAIQKHASGISELNSDQLAAADVNGDGNVDVLDAAEIQKYAAGIISEFKKKV